MNNYWYIPENVAILFIKVPPNNCSAFSNYKQAIVLLFIY